MKHLLSIGTLFVLAALVGCDAEPVISPEVKAARAKFLLDQAPTDPVLIADARKLPAGSPVVIVGRLGVAGQPTWEKGKAMFAVSDAHPSIAGHAHAQGEDDSDCVFCKRSKTERLAMVQIVGDNGEPLPLDGQALLGAEEGREVVVHGTGTVNSLDMLVINADGIYLK